MCFHISPVPLNSPKMMLIIGKETKTQIATRINDHLLKSLLKCFILKYIYFKAMAYCHFTSSNIITASLLSSPSLVKDNLSSLKSPHELKRSDDFASIFTGYS